MNSQNLELTQKIGIRLSQQQLRFVRMLELNAPELDEAVERELEDNPALGVKSDDAEEEPARYLPLPVRQAPADDVQFTPPDNTETLYDHLLAQLSERELSTTVDEAARFIAGSLDSNGYLTVPLEQLVDDMAFGPGLDVTAEEADRAFAEVRSLDPPGIGALNLKDCLELQLAAMPKSRERDDAMRVVGETYEAFIRKHRHRIVSQLHLDDERVDKALDLIEDAKKQLPVDLAEARKILNARNEYLAAAKREFAKATKEYESVKDKLYDVIRGKSSLPESVISEMAEEAKRKMMAASEKVSALNSEMEQSNDRTNEIRRDYQNIMKWSEIFDSSDMAVKKMIAGYLIKKISVYSGYRLHIEFNINFAQFELGLEIPNEYQAENLA